MKRMILVMCIGMLAATAHSQFDERDRLVSINPLRTGDGGFMKANNPLFYNNRPTDTSLAKKRTEVVKSISNEPFAFRISSVEAMCDLNSLQMSWTAAQHQNDADRFEIEQSADGGITWTNIGVLPATRNQTGNVPYNFMYNKSLGNVDLRVAAVDISGEKRYSGIIRSACNNTNLFSADNLVSTTATIRIGSNRTQNVKMILTNQSGIVVLAREAGLTQGVNSISVDMSSLQPGVYLLTVIWPGGEERSVKIVKQ